MSEGPEMAAEPHVPHAHVSSSTGKQIVASIIGSTAAGVGSYQLNRHINNKSGVPAPQLDSTTGGMPNNAAQTSANIHKVTTKVRRKKGGKQYGN